MKSTPITNQLSREEKIAALKRLIKYGILVDSIDFIHVCGPVDAPEFWINHKKVSGAMYRRTMNFLAQSPEYRVLILDWSHEGTVNLQMTVNEVSE